MMFQLADLNIYFNGDGTITAIAFNTDGTKLFIYDKVHD